MTMSTKPLAALALLVSAVSAYDDDTCWDSRRGRRVHPRDCQHNCCWGNDCGSSSECKNALVIGMIILGVGLFICCIVGAIIFMYCGRRGCFARQQEVHVVGEPQHQPAYQQPYPAAGYPPAQQQCPPPAYPPQQQPYPPQQQAYPQPVTGQPVYPPQQ